MAPPKCVTIDNARYCRDMTSSQRPATETTGTHAGTVARKPLDHPRGPNKPPAIEQHTVNDAASSHEPGPRPVPKGEVAVSGTSSIDEGSSYGIEARYDFLQHPDYRLLVGAGLQHRADRFHLTTARVSVAPRFLLGDATDRVRPALGLQVGAGAGLDGQEGARAEYSAAVTVGLDIAVGRGMYAGVLAGTSLVQRDDNDEPIAVSPMIGAELSVGF